MRVSRALRRKLHIAIASIPARLSSLRYRITGNYRRFITQTLKPLPLTPPPTPSGRPSTLLLFAHYDREGLIDPYVRYYLQALHCLGATIIFVSGSPELDPASAGSIAHLCAGIYARRTLALDFGSWHLAWRILRSQGWSLDHFDRFILANDSVFAPLFPLEEMFSTFTGADMYGAIESNEVAPHLQSFFLVWDLNSRTRPFLNDLWDHFRYVVNKQQLIDAYEIGLSARARAAGLTIRPFIDAAQVQALLHSIPGHQLAARRAPSPANNTLYFYDVLIERLRFPFLKAVLPRGNTPWHDSMTHLGSFIQQHTAYPYTLIQNNCNRLGAGPPSWIKPAPAPLDN